MPGTAIRSFSVKSFSVLTFGLRVISHTEPEPTAPMPITALSGSALALSHSVRKPGAPPDAMSSAPDSMASLMMLPPSMTR